MRSHRRHCLRAGLGVAKPTRSDHCLGGGHRLSPGCWLAAFSGLWLLALLDNGQRCGTVLEDGACGTGFVGQLGLQRIAQHGWGHLVRYHVGRQRKRISCLADVAACGGTTQNYWARVH